jgi:Fe-Mn family superoxide dismutase
MPFPIEGGMVPFLSAPTLELLKSLQSSYLQQLNESLSGTEHSKLNLYQLAQQTHRDIGNSLINHYACQAWNMDFWLQGLTKTPREPLPALLQAIERDFGSMEALQDEFGASAESIIASGWTWLAKRPNGRLVTFNTYNGDAPFLAKIRNPPKQMHLNTGTFRSLVGMGAYKTTPEEVEEEGPLVPIIGLNMWEHAWLPDYGLDKAAYVKNYWKCVNWGRAAVILNIF